MTALTCKIAFSLGKMTGVVGAGMKEGNPSASPDGRVVGTGMMRGPSEIDWAKPVPKASGSSTGSTRRRLQRFSRLLAIRFFARDLAQLNNPSFAVNCGCCFC